MKQIREFSGAKVASVRLPQLPDNYPCKFISLCYFDPNSTEIGMLAHFHHPTPYPNSLFSQRRQGQVCQIPGECETKRCPSRHWYVPPLPAPCLLPPRYRWRLQWHYQCIHDPAILCVR